MLKNPPAFVRGRGTKPAFQRKNCNSTVRMTRTGTQVRGGMGPVTICPVAFLSVSAAFAEVGAGKTEV